MSDLAHVQTQALHDARRQLADLQVEYDRLRDAVLYARHMGLPGHVSEYLADALSPKRPGDDSPRPRTLGAALAAYDGAGRALAQALAELRECRALLDAVRDALAPALAIKRETAGEWFPIYSEDEDDEENRILMGIGWAPPYQMEYEPVLVLPEIEPRDDDAIEDDVALTVAAVNGVRAVAALLSKGLP